MFPSSGLRIARIFGIEIVINISWLVIFVLVGFSLGDTYNNLRLWLPFDPAYARTAHFPAGPWPWIIGFLTAVFFFGSLLMHELSHSVIAKRNGIEIHRITLFLFGGVAEMSSDVDTANTELKMAAAGPLMTFFLAFVFALLYLLAISLHAGMVLVYPLITLVEINVLVGLFNLLPGFPLDGGRVFRALIWKRTGDIRKATSAASIAGRIIGVGIAVVGVYFIIRSAWLSGFWFIIIGFFIYRLAIAGYQQTLFRLAAADTRVSDIMYTDVPVVDGSTSLTTLRNHYFSSYRLPVFPVGREGRIDGTVSVDDLSKVAASEWEILDAGRIARPLQPELVVEPDTSLDKVIKMVLGGQEYLLVMKEGRVEGMLTREEVMKYVNMRLKLTSTPPPKS
jgi:Zn-dependent protease/predicted transcriptional regulator